MALQKIEVPIMVNGGIDTKTDEKLVNKGQSLKSENVDYSKLGAIKKTNGTVILPDTTDNGMTLSDVATKIFSHNNEIVVLGRQGKREIYSYSSSEDNWKSKAKDLNDSFYGNSCVPVEAIEIDEQVDISACYGNSSAECLTKGFSVSATLEERGDGLFQIRVTKVDYITGEESSKEIYLVSSLATRYVEAKVNVLDQATPYIFITYVDDQNIMASVYDEDMNAISVGNIIQPLSVVPAMIFPSFSTKIIDGKLFVATNGGGTNLIRLVFIDITGAFTSTKDFVTTNAVQQIALGRTFQNKTSISVCYDATNIYISFVVSNDGTTTTYPSRAIAFFAISRADLTVTTIAESIILAAATLSRCFTRLSIEMSGVANEIIMIASDEIAGATLPVNYEADSQQLNGDTFVFKIDVSGVPSLTNLTQFSIIRTTQICSNILFLPNVTDEFYFIGVTLINQSLTFHLYLVDISTSDANHVIVSRFAVYGGFNWLSFFNTYYLPSLDNLNDINLGKDNFYYFSFLKQGEARSVGGYINGIPRASTVKLSLGGFNALGNVTKLSQATHYCGGILTEYNSSSLKNSGFCHPPVIITADGIDDAGTLPAGDYSYLAVYRYQDQNGETHTSQPSKEVTVSVTGATRIDIGVLSSKGAVDVNKDGFSFVDIYRTLVNSQGPYYLLTTLAGGVLVEYNDNTPDSSIDGNDFVYTTGGVLRNTTIPPMTHICSGLERIFGISASDQNKIYYSQKRIIENSIDWNLALSFRVDGFNKKAGYAVGVECIDDKIIILKTDSVMAISGDGPLQTGEQNNFTIPAILSQQIGCSEKQSIVATPNGLMFKGKKGIYLVDRTLNVSYVGAAVESYNSEAILDADVSTVKNEVYFITSNRLMVYNYMQDKWSTNTFLKGKSLCIWRDQLTVLKSDGRIYYQVDNIFKDNTSYYSMKFTSPWYKTTGIVGFGRLYEIMILGKYKSDHTLNIRVYYDYDETDYNDYSFDVTTTNLYEFSVKPQKQKCQSFKLEICDVATTGTGESFELSGIGLRVGAKKGFYKLSDSNKG